MIKCRVFSSCWERSNGEVHWGPEKAFNKFCEENEGIEILKIDTIVLGKDNNDKQIYLYYKILETTHSYCSGDFSIRNNPIIQKEDLIYYLHDGEEVIAKIIQCDPANDRVTISFRDGNIINQAHISYKNVCFVPDSIEVSNFKPGDRVIYRCNCKEYEAVILRTYHANCIIEYARTIVETSYRYIDKVED